ncbi:ferrous iron transport protein B [Negadavirga shengliensis]|uniref:Ferrous iron transport protein B n=1 Tax=Negadavirga shengliensis TaxID=1389218 RepID=A0ABV9SYG5_9BACT
MDVATLTGTKTVAIIGNPNVGKSSVFNHLTGLNQKVGNYPGVTVDKMIGSLKAGGRVYELVDLPGTYSLYPKSEDEVIAHRVLNGVGGERPDFVLVILDACNLERSLLLATQVIDLGLPVALAINMKDMALKRGLTIKTFELYKSLGVPIIMTDARHADGMDAIRNLIAGEKFESPKPLLEADSYAPQVLLDEVLFKFGLTTPYQAFQLLVFGEHDSALSLGDKNWLKEKSEAYGFDKKGGQVKETETRYKKIKEILTKAIAREDGPGRDITLSLDTVFLHRVWGYLIFLAIMLLVFQAIFAWAEYPMDLIDRSFTAFGSWVYDTFPPGVFTDLLAEGIIPGIGGIVIFIPQIALLFGFLAFLEDTGYFSRVVFLMDRMMRPFGLHGKSIVPLISGMACAIPGIMATRNISHAKERLITILVTPWMSCSARLPVYIILIGLTVPDEPFLGINLQAIALLAMYLLGASFTLLGALVLKYILKTKELSYLIADLPVYRFPRWKTVVLTMFNKSRIFVVEAGKVILMISVVLWVLASHGPSGQIDALEEEKAALQAEASKEEREEIEELYASRELEASYIGIMGKGIEPIIRPLGYDWKIGIALLTSFAAREVFVATIATIYSIGGDVENEMTIREKLASEVHPDTGEKVFDKATGFSLMVFYAFAMQCMSTLAVVYRETKTWKWPLVQTVAMTGVAYLAAFITYQIFS